MDTKKHSRFSGSWGFVLSAVGSAVGMANVWGFPAKLGSNGGSAFLIAYLFFIVLFSVVGLSAEYAAGRRSRSGGIGAYASAWESRNPKLRTAGGVVGWLPMIGSLCIALGYAVIISYILKALLASLTGELMTVDTAVWFESFSGSGYSVIPFHAVVVVITLITLFLGASGIEKSNKVMMPIFFLIFVVLAVRVAFLPGAIEGYKFMFTPDWSALLNPMVWVWAMGQALFSLSVTGCGMVVYGSYMGEKENVVKLAVQTALFDTIAALVAALVIIPACFAYGLDIGAGPSLLFVTLPRILQDIPLGRLFAAILYIAMIFAGISSLQTMFESVAASIIERFPKINRVISLVIIGVLCLGVGVNMEQIDSWGPWMDIVSIYIIPIGAALGAISWFWIMKRNDLMDEINRGADKPHGTLWYSVGRYVYVPLVLVLCCIALFMHIAF